MIKYKKYLFAILLIFASQSFNLFGFYSSSSFIDILVHSNQARARIDALGFLAGPDNVRVAVGLTGANGFGDLIFHNRNNYDDTNAFNQFIPSALIGVGYNSDLFGIGFGYEFTYKSQAYMVHTPVITFTALSDSIRFNIPVSVGVGYSSKALSVDLRKTIAISTGIEARYYFEEDIPAINHIRLYVNYGNARIPNVKDNSQYMEQSSVGFQTRIYFKAETPEVKIFPILRVQYDQSLPTKLHNLSSTSVFSIYDNFDITAKGLQPFTAAKGAGQSAGAQGDPNLASGLSGGYVASIPEGMYAIEPYRVNVAIPVGFMATSQDGNIHLYLEPSISYTIINAKGIYASSDMNSRRKTPFMSLGYVVYGELYIRPVKSLELYLEMQAGGTSRFADDMKTLNNDIKLVFNGSTGIHYYF